ncbi:hypothetical protein FRC98_19335 [Lujinxingia vulgaris]|uniref:Uncharacterized protein n=1 Tax=Lujinxingia vulgaris TaxID=2600176 RepID=A0A5C6X668_9DELT|nr:hypothetical protein [Lujinxingia vulgaris]TXD34187.1 hypothetical protein FRC98_19335 [Lujinxingia vulgaris]
MERLGGRLLIVWVGLMWGCAFGAGCSRGAQAEEAQGGPYRVVAMQVMEEGGEVGGVGVQGWAPEPVRVQEWWERALRESDEGLSPQGGGEGLKGRLMYRVKLNQALEGSVLVVRVEGRLEQEAVRGDGKAVSMRAQHVVRHPLVSDRPPEALLGALGRTLLRQGVDEVMEGLRAQAMVYQAAGGELGRWCADEEALASARLLAVQRVVEGAVEEAEEALIEAAGGRDEEVAFAAAQALWEMESSGAARALTELAERMSREQRYDDLIGLLPKLGTLSTPWVAVYLETLADAHHVSRVREHARRVLEMKAGQAQADAQR